jgi:hypothetical protein
MLASTPVPVMALSLQMPLGMSPLVRIHPHTICSCPGEWPAPPPPPPAANQKPRPATISRKSRILSDNGAVTYRPRDFAVAAAAPVSDSVVNGYTAQITKVPFYCLQVSV